MPSNQERKRLAKRDRRIREVQKLQHRIRVTFESNQDFDPVAYAMMGQGYMVSQRLTHLTPGQIAYRNKTAREILRSIEEWDGLLPSGVGLSRCWQKGIGPVAEVFRNQILPSLRAVYMEKLAEARKHPNPKVAPKNEE